jgi:hypothetical protein
VDGAEIEFDIVTYHKSKQQHKKHNAEIDTLAVSTWAAF